MVETNENPLPKGETPKNSVEDYLDCRRQMRSCTTSHEYYVCLLETITSGASILDDNGDILSREINDALSDKSNYPALRNMEYDKSTGTYSCSTGSSATGMVSVLSNDLELGKMDVKDQQADRIIQRLKPLDLKIYRELQNKGWIQKQNASANLRRLLD